MNRRTFSAVLAILVAFAATARAHDSFEQHLTTDPDYMGVWKIGQDWSKSTLKLFDPARVEKDVRVKAFRGYLSVPLSNLVYLEVYEDNGRGFAVQGASPLVRMIPIAKWRPENARYKCSEFVGTEAVIFVHGVCGNWKDEGETEPWGIGTSWEHMDAGNLRAVAFWNANPRRPDPPHEHRWNGKADQPPAYFQFVENFNGDSSSSRCGNWDGPIGRHDARAIARMVRNFRLAWKAGVTQLEIVTHSNGVVTTHAAWKRFVQDLGTVTRESKAKMHVHMNHLQAAPNDPWEDLFPLQTSYVRPDEERLVLDRVQFWYNHPDGATYDFWHRGSWVGRRESLPWVRKQRNPPDFEIIRVGRVGVVHRLNSSKWDKQIAAQFLCTSNDAKCGDHPENGSATGSNHWENFALRDYSRSFIADEEGPMIWVKDDYE